MIWLIAILLLAFFAGMGFLRGAIQMGISLLGLFLGLVLAVSISLPSIVGPGGAINPASDSEFSGNAVGLLIVDTLFNFLQRVGLFLLVGFVFLIAGIVVHFKVCKHFRFKADEAMQLMFRRLNKRLGVAFGLVIGIVYTILIGVLIFGPGYLFDQVTPRAEVGGTTAGWLKFLIKTRASMENSGLERMAASLDPMPAKFYEVSDIIGLGINNPRLVSRFLDYPPLLKAFTLFESQEAIVLDTESEDQLGDMIGSFTGELADALFKIDLRDFRTYLETGKSPLYDDEKLLGRWELDGKATVIHLKRTKIGLNVPATYVDTAGVPRETRVKIKSREFQQFKEMWVDGFLRGLKLFVYPDNTLAFAAPKPPEPPEEPPEEDDYNSDDPYSRYGEASNPRPNRVQQPAPPERQPIAFSGEGDWERKSQRRYEFKTGEGNYRVTLDKNSRLVIQDMIPHIMKRSGMPDAKDNFAVITVDLVFRRVYTAF